MRVLVLSAAMVWATPASAEVDSAGPHGFEISHSINLDVPREQAFAAFSQVRNWSTTPQTYSGEASPLSAELCQRRLIGERLDGGGGVEHLRVAYLQPGERVVLTGSLGPLLYEATSGVMDVKVEKIAGGSRISMNYRAAGFANGGAEKMAPLVDQVLVEQMKRLRTYAAAGPNAKR